MMPRFWYDITPARWLESTMMMLTRAEDNGLQAGKLAACAWLPQSRTLVLTASPKVLHRTYTLVENFATTFGMHCAVRC